MGLRRLLKRRARDVDDDLASARDALALLSYCAKHRGEWQSQRTLGEAIGVSQQRICYLLHDNPKEWGWGNCILTRVAHKYGYQFVILNQRGRIIDVVYRGRA